MRLRGIDGMGSQLRRARRCILRGLLVCACLASTGAVRAQEPPVAPGVATSGTITVALLGPGIDYRAANLQGALARDGEGDLIAWDFSDGDGKPFAEGGAGRDAASAIAEGSAATIVVVKERPDDPQAFGPMMGFVARTPARIVVWLTADPTRADWSILISAVSHFKDRLFLIPKTGPGPAAAFAGLLKAPNVFVVDFHAPSGPLAAKIGAGATIGAVMGMIAATSAGIWAKDAGSTAQLVKSKLAQDF